MQLHPQKGVAGQPMSTTGSLLSISCKREDISGKRNTGRASPRPRPATSEGHVAAHYCMTACEGKMTMGEIRPVRYDDSRRGGGQQEARRDIWIRLFSSLILPSLHSSYRLKRPFFHAVLHAIVPVGFGPSGRVPDQRHYHLSRLSRPAVARRRYRDTGLLFAFFAAR